MIRYARTTIIAALGAALVGASACAPAPDPNEESTPPAPDRGAFIDGGVSAFMERRCGALDCHGQIGRPLRLYGQYGLRLEQGDGGARDLRPTTPAEQLENYRSVVGLEPEDLGESVATHGAYVDFQLFKKPLGIASGGVRHKGGSVLRPSDSDPGWACLHGWVAGQLDPARCRQATF